MLHVLQRMSLLAATWLLVVSPYIARAGETSGTPTPEDDRKSLLDTLQTRYPQIAPADYALGAATFGAERQPTPPARVSEILTQGKQLWERKFKDRRSLANCFPNGGRRIAATYPQYDARLKKVLTLEGAINQCLKLHGEAQYELSDSATTGALTAYLRSLADGSRMAIRVTGAAAREKYAAGRQFFLSRKGQANYACASCHVQHAGQILRDRPLSAAIGQAAQWPRIDAQGNAVTLQMHYASCLKRMGAQALLPGDEALDNLEYFHSTLSNGMPLRALPAS